MYTNAGFSLVGREGGKRGGISYQLRRLSEKDLPIGQIEEFLVLAGDVARRINDSLLATILARVERPDSRESGEGDADAGGDRDEGGRVARGICRSKEGYQQASIKADYDIKSSPWARKV